MISQNKIIEIDLTQKQVLLKEFTAALAREHLAGFGFNIKISGERLIPCTDHTSYCTVVSHHTSQTPMYQNYPQTGAGDIDRRPESTNGPDSLNRVISP